MEALALEESMAPDESAFRAHLAGARFQQGVDRGRWRLVTLQWPIAVIAVTSAARQEAPSEFFLRFQLEGYPAGATAAPWDLENDELLSPEKRPKGERVERAFRTDWEEGKSLYVPWDRVAFAGHGDWPNKYPGQLWKQEEGISCYLRHTHNLLNDEDYQGV